MQSKKQLLEQAEKELFNTDDLNHIITKLMELKANTRFEVVKAQVNVSIDLTYRIIKQLYDDIMTDLEKR